MCIASITASDDSIDIMDGQFVNLQMAYFEQEPFIFNNSKTKNLDGIFVKIQKKALEYCKINMTFKEQFKDIGSMRDALETKNKKFKTLVNEAYIWMPLVHNFKDSFIRRVPLKKMSLFTSPGMEVIVHRSSLSLARKIYVGLEGCVVVLSLSIFLVIIVGAVVWSMVGVVF